MPAPDPVHPAQKRSERLRHHGTAEDRARWLQGHGTRARVDRKGLPCGFGMRRRRHLCGVAVPDRRAAAQRPVSGDERAPGHDHVCARGRAPSNLRLSLSNTPDAHARQDRDVPVFPVQRFSDHRLAPGSSDARERPVARQRRSAHQRQADAPADDGVGRYPQVQRDR